jgi:hypothetical protein
MEGPGERLHEQDESARVMAKETTADVSERSVEGQL